MRCATTTDHGPSFSALISTVSTVGSYGCRDVWDMLHVYVGPSQVEFAGEGLYARWAVIGAELVT